LRFIRGVVSGVAGERPARFGVRADGESSINNQAPSVFFL
jgi:hypothetical protein